MYNKWFFFFQFKTYILHTQSAWATIFLTPSKVSTALSFFYFGKKSWFTLTRRHWKKKHNICLPFTDTSQTEILNQESWNPSFHLQQEYKYLTSSLSSIFLLVPTDNTRKQLPQSMIKNFFSHLPKLPSWYSIAIFQHCRFHLPPRRSVSTRKPRWRSKPPEEWEEIPNRPTDSTVFPRSTPSQRKWYTPRWSGCIETTIHLCIQDWEVPSPGLSAPRKPPNRKPTTG